MEEIPGETKTILYTDTSSLDGLQFKPTDNDNKEDIVQTEDNQNILSKQLSETRSAPGSSSVSPVQFDSPNTPISNDDISVLNNSSLEEFIPPSTESPLNNLNLEHELKSSRGDIKNITKTEKNNFPNEILPTLSHKSHPNGGTIPKTTINTLFDKQNTEDKENIEKTQPMNININKELQDKLKDIGEGQEEYDNFFYI